MITTKAYISTKNGYMSKAWKGGRRKGSKNKNHILASYKKRMGVGALSGAALGATILPLGLGVGAVAGAGVGALSAHSHNRGVRAAGKQMQHHILGN
jgi:hypothetical protein